MKSKDIFQRLKNVDFEKSAAIKALLLIALVLIITFLAPSSNQLKIHYDVGTIWTHEDVIAPFSFPIYKNDAEYQKEVKQASANVKPVFDRIELEKYRLDSVASFIVGVQNALELQVRIDRERNKRLFARDSAALHNLLQNLPYRFSNSEWHQLLTSIYRNPMILRRLGGLVPIMTSIITHAYDEGIIDRPRNQVSSDVIVIRQNNSETPVPLQQVLTLRDVSRQIDQAAINFMKGDTTTSQIIASAISAQILPNLSFNRAQTQREINAAIDLVPRTVGFVKENERIVSKHDRITNEIKLKLDSLEKALRERTGKTDLILQFIGKFLMVFVIIGLFSIYLFLFRKKIFYNNKMLSLIAVLFIFEALLTFFAFTAQTALPVQYLVLVPVASMILAIIFDSRVAFQGTVAIALLVGAMKGSDFGAAFASLSAGALAVYTVRDIKNRTQIFRSLVFIFIGYAIATLATSLQKAEDASTILSEFSFIAINSVLSPIITFGLLIFFERVFNIATDLTLLELSDFNQPLLRELSQKAPGTFHHSIIVGTLAEKAAEAVGANPILARVGAYYHDIGKTVKPEYFVENTMDSNKSKHDWLPPDVSVQVVVSHVTDGIELARKHRLPQRIVDFIPMHHGTTLVAYFYGKALRRPFATGDVSEEDYRYDGPKPRSKETAIVMLADSVEAATRSLQEKSLENVEMMIDTIVKSRYEEGQLDETNLTFGDLTKIKESFLAVLSGIYHKRIEYPGQQEKLDETRAENEAQEPVGDLSQKEIDALAPPVKKDRKKTKKTSSRSASKRPRRK
ncbi:MAG: HDIG domain-containing protein [Bacteroidetes bacterium]|nr:HDIG domain-containing protein [Bacteroidota bacterium]